MLIVNDDHRRRAGVASLDQCCPYCGLAFAGYPLTMSDGPRQTVYHAACPLELAQECRSAGRDLATDGFQILAVTLTTGNSRMKHVRARLPVVSQTVKFTRYPSNSS